MHWINLQLRRAKVDERVSWWSGGQTCYQVPLSTIDKLVGRLIIFNVLLLLLGTYHLSCQLAPGPSCATMLCSALLYG
jgi:hypothetical protein